MSRIIAAPAAPRNKEQRRAPSARHSARSVASRAGGTAGPASAGPRGRARPGIVSRETILRNLVIFAQVAVPAAVSAAAPLPAGGIADRDV